jgi:hypothetical protein
MNFILNEFYESKVIEWILHVNKTFGPHQYDMTISHDLMSQLRIILDFDGQTIMWDESTIKMKEYKDLSDINSPINEFIGMKNHMKVKHLMMHLHVLTLLCQSIESPIYG